ncbi:MAG: hypothetical protein HFJ29_07940 [Clostridia bacterium]|nr:hypothetical protein [Clostridia bacterium]
MSRYSKLLATMIAESQCTAKEIVEKCNEMGNGIDVTRLSKLQSGKLPAPSEKVSRDLARACNADERKLVIEGYLEKAPQEIIDVFVTLKTQSALAGLRIMQQTLPKEQIERLRDLLEVEPLSDCILGIIDSKNQEIEVLADEFNITEGDFKFILKDPPSIPVTDHAMFPMIPEKARVNLKLQENYNDGDILAVKIKKEENIIFRYALFNNDKIILTALNKQYDKLVYKKDEIIILGKAVKVITEI